MSLCRKNKHTVRYQFNTVANVKQQLEITNSQMKKQKRKETETES